jgi:hypothetical protein
MLLLTRRAHAQDYDLASFQSGAIVDRGATGFAHVAMYRAGQFEMEQARTAVPVPRLMQPHAVAWMRSLACS